MPSSFSPDPTAPLTAAREQDIRDEVLAEVVAWLVKKAREHRAKGPQYTKQADVIGVLADKVSRGAVRPNNLATFPPGAEPAPEDVPALLAEIDRLRARVAEADDLRTAFEAERRQWRATTDTVVRRESDRADNAIRREEAMEEHAREVEQERDQLRAELAETRSRLSAVLDLCDREERNAMRWEHSIPVPEWVAPIQRAALGDDKREQQGGARPGCTAEHGGPGYTHCEMPADHDGPHEAAMGNLRRATWGGAR